MEPRDWTTRPTSASRRAGNPLIPALRRQARPREAIVKEFPSHAARRSGASLECRGQFDLQRALVPRFVDRRAREQPPVDVALAGPSGCSWRPGGRRRRAAARGSSFACAATTSAGSPLARREAVGRRRASGPAPATGRPLLWTRSHWATVSIAIPGLGLEADAHSSAPPGRWRAQRLEAAGRASGGRPSASRSSGPRPDHVETTGAPRNSTARVDASASGKSSLRAALGGRGPGARGRCLRAGVEHEARAGLDQDRQRELVAEAAGRSGSRTATPRNGSRWWTSGVSAMPSVAEVGEERAPRPSSRCEAKAVSCCREAGFTGGAPAGRTVLQRSSDFIAARRLRQARHLPALHREVVLGHFLDVVVLAARQTPR